MCGGPHEKKDEAYTKKLHTDHPLSSLVVCQKSSLACGDYLLKMSVGPALYESCKLMGEPSISSFFVQNTYLSLLAVSEIADVISDT